MKKLSFPSILLAGFTWIVIISSCANEGMPTGGPRDSIPPVLVETYPKYQSLQFSGNEVRLTFNEFIVPDQVQELLVVSPPLEKRPTILTRSKTLIIRFNEALKKDFTYSLDFKNAIVDNNERNPLENLRFSFSTGDRIDSLRVAGRVVDAFRLEPVKKTLVLLHKNLHDSAAYRIRPDYIARTDDEGIYLFDNLAEGSYRIYALNDMNSDLMYNEGAEQMAFLDSLVVPSMEYIEQPDTLLSGTDSLLVSGHIHFHPGPIFLRQFTEDIFDQYLKRSNRDSRYQCTFVFNEPVRDTFSVNLVDTVVDNWYVLEPNEKFDSLTLWLADTTMASREHIRMELVYYQLDSLNQPFIQRDTVEMTFAEREEETRRKRRVRDKDEEENLPVVPQFDWVTNLSSAPVDLNSDLMITSPYPVAAFDAEAIRLYLTSDSLKRPVPFRFMTDTSAWRTYRISYAWESGMGYTLEIDSAACTNIFGITSKKLVMPFKTRTIDYYGIIKLDLRNLTSQMLLQLLENNERETVLREKIVSDDQQVVFDYLVPGKYKVKAVYDENRNGVWDSGSFQDKIQPERVAYINEVVKVRANWDNNLTWDLTPDPDYVKNIRDPEQEEQDRKAAEEKLRREQQQAPSGPQTNPFGQGGAVPGGIQPGRR